MFLNDFLTWQECQFWNQTFEDELNEVDVAEMRHLIDDDGNADVEEKR